MFVENKYYSWYLALIDKAKNRSISGYVERHHIVPKSFGGINHKNNLVALTFREHFIVHWLLVKCTEGEEKRKMQYALIRLGRRKSGQTIRSSWQYALARKTRLEAGISEAAKKKMSETLKHSEKVVAYGVRLSESNLKRLADSWTHSVISGLPPITDPIRTWEPPPHNTSASLKLIEHLNKINGARKGKKKTGRELQQILAVAEKRRGKPRTAFTKNKLSQSGKLRWQDPVYRSKMLRHLHQLNTVLHGVRITDNVGAN